MELILTDLTRHKLPAISLCRSKFLVFSLNSLLNAGASSVKKNKTSVINGSACHCSAADDGKTELYE
jgi:hypothetical protein